VGFLSFGGALRLGSGLYVTTSKAGLLFGIVSFGRFGMVDQKRTSSALRFSASTFPAKRMLSNWSFFARAFRRRLVALFFFQFSGGGRGSGGRGSCGMILAMDDSS